MYYLLVNTVTLHKLTNKKETTDNSSTKQLFSFKREKELNSFLNNYLSKEKSKLNLINNNSRKDINNKSSNPKSLSDLKFKFKENSSINNNDIDSLKILKNQLIKYNNIGDLVSEANKNNIYAISKQFPKMGKIFTKSGYICDFPFLYNKNTYYNSCVKFTNNKYFCKINLNEENIDGNKNKKSTKELKTNTIISTLSYNEVIYFDECIDRDETENILVNSISEKLDYESQILSNVFNEIKKVVLKTKIEKIILLFESAENYCKSKTLNFNFDCLQEKFIDKLNYYSRKNSILSISDIKIKYSLYKNNVIKKIEKIINNYNSNLKEFIKETLYKSNQESRFQFITKANIDKFNLNSENSDLLGENNNNFNDNNKDAVSNLSYINIKNINNWKSSKLSFKQFLFLLDSTYDNCIEECRESLDYLFDLNFSRFSLRIKAEIITYLLDYPDSPKKVFSEINNLRKSAIFNNEEKCDNERERKIAMYYCNLVNKILLSDINNDKNKNPDNSEISKLIRNILYTSNDDGKHEDDLDTSNSNDKNHKRKEENSKSSKQIPKIIIPISLLLKIVDNKNNENNSNSNNINSCNNKHFLILFSNKYYTNNKYLTNLFNINSWTTRLIISVIYRYILFKKSFYKEIISNDISFATQQNQLYHTETQILNSNDFLKISKIIPLIKPFSTYTAKIYSIMRQLFNKWYHITSTITSTSNNIKLFLKDFFNLNRYFSKFLNKNIFKIKSDSLISLKKNIADVEVFKKIFAFEDKFERFRNKIIHENKVKALDYYNLLFYNYDVYEKGLFSNLCNKYVVVDMFFIEKPSQKPFTDVFNIGAEPSFKYIFDLEVRLFYISANIVVDHDLIDSCGVLSVTSSSLIELFLNEENIKASFVIEKNKNNYNNDKNYKSNDRDGGNYTKDRIINRNNEKEYLFFISFEKSINSIKLKGLFSSISKDKDTIEDENKSLKTILFTIIPIIKESCGEISRNSNDHDKNNNILSILNQYSIKSNSENNVNIKDQLSNHINTITPDFILADKDNTNDTTRNLNISCNSSLWKLQICNYSEDFLVDCNASCDQLNKTREREMLVYKNINIFSEERSSLKLNMKSIHYDKENKGIEDNIESLNKSDDNSFYSRCMNSCTVFVWKLPEFKCIQSHMYLYDFEEVINKCNANNNWEISAHYSSSNKIKNTLEKTGLEKEKNNIDEINSKLREYPNYPKDNFTNEDSTVMFPNINNNSNSNSSTNNFYSIFNNSNSEALLKEASSYLNYFNIKNINSINEIMLSTGNMKYFISFNKENLFYKNIYFNESVVQSNLSKENQDNEQNTEKNIEDSLKTQLENNISVIKFPLNSSTGFTYDQQGNNNLNAFLIHKIDKERDPQSHSNYLIEKSILVINDKNEAKEIYKEDITNLIDINEDTKDTKNNNSNKENISLASYYNNNYGSLILTRGKQLQSKSFFRNLKKSVHSRINITPLRENIYSFLNSEFLITKIPIKTLEDTFLLQTVTYNNSYHFHLQKDSTIFILVEVNEDLQEISNLLLADGFKQLDKEQIKQIEQRNIEQKNNHYPRINNDIADEDLINSKANADKKSSSLDSSNSEKNINIDFEVISFNQNSLFNIKNIPQSEYSKKQTFNYLLYNLDKNIYNYFYMCEKDETSFPECVLTQLKNNNDTVFHLYFNIFTKKLNKGEIELNYNFFDFDDLNGSMHLVLLKPDDSNDNTNNVNLHLSSFSSFFCFIYDTIPSSTNYDEYIKSLKSDDYPAKQKESYNEFPLKAKNKFVINNCGDTGIGDKSEYGLKIGFLRSTNNEIKDKSMRITNIYNKDNNSNNNNIEEKDDRNTTREDNYNINSLDRSNFFISNSIKSIPFYKDYTLSSPQIVYHKSTDSLFILDRFGNLFRKKLVLEQYKEKDYLEDSSSSQQKRLCFYDSGSNNNLIENTWELIRTKLRYFQISETTLIIQDFFKTYYIQKDLINFSLPNIQIKFVWLDRIITFVLSPYDCIWAIDSKNRLLYAERIKVLEPYGTKESKSNINSSNDVNSSDNNIKIIDYGLKKDFVYEIILKQSSKNSTVPAFKNMAISNSKLLITDRLNKIFMMKEIFNYKKEKCNSGGFELINLKELEIPVDFYSNKSITNKSNLGNEGNASFKKIKYNKNNGFYLLDNLGKLYFRDKINSLNNYYGKSWKRVEENEIDKEYNQESGNDSNVLYNKIIDFHVDDKNVYCLTSNGKIIIYNSINYPRNDDSKV